MEKCGSPNIFTCLIGLCIIAHHECYSDRSQPSDRFCLRFHGDHEFVPVRLVLGVWLRLCAAQLRSARYGLEPA
jgi:hypothetical protein